MDKKEINTCNDVATFLNELMRRRKALPSHLASELGVSHATIGRWLSGTDVPNMRSCQRLAQYSGVPLHQILATVGYLPKVSEASPDQWPEFREYARHKYPAELDEDLIAMIEDLIERRRAKRYDASRADAEGAGC